MTRSARGRPGAAAVCGRVEDIDGVCAPISTAEGLPPRATEGSPVQTRKRNGPTCLVAQRARAPQREIFTRDEMS